MPIPDGYFEIRVNDSNKCKKDKYFFLDISKSRGIKAFGCVQKISNKTLILTFLFDEKKWTKENAQEWVDSHKSLGWYFDEEKVEHKIFVPLTKVVDDEDEVQRFVKETLKIEMEIPKGYGLVAGKISSQVVDRDEEIVDQKAVLEASDEYLKDIGVIRWMHQREPVGKMIDIREDKDGDAYGYAIIDKQLNNGDYWRRVKDGIVKGFSIGFMAVQTEKYCVDKDKCYRKYTEIKLFEVSIVDIPSNPKSIIDLVKLLVNEKEIGDLVEKMEFIEEVVDREKQMLTEDGMEVITPQNAGKDIFEERISGFKVPVGEGVWAVYNKFRRDDKWFFDGFIHTHELIKPEDFTMYKRMEGNYRLFSVKIESTWKDLDGTFIEIPKGNLNFEILVNAEQKIVCSEEDDTPIFEIEEPNKSKDDIITKIKVDIMTEKENGTDAPEVVEEQENEGTEQKTVPETKDYTEELEELKELRKFKEKLEMKEEVRKELEVEFEKKYNVEKEDVVPEKKTLSDITQKFGEAMFESNEMKLALGYEQQLTKGEEGLLGWIFHKARKADFAFPFREGIVDHVIKSAWSGATNYGSQMLPTEVADEIILAVRQKSWHRNVFRIMPMKAQTTTIPKFSASPTVHRRTQTTTSGDTDAETQEPTQRHTSTEVTLTATTIIANIAIGKFVIAYGIASQVKFIKEDIINVFREVEENMIINGDTETTLTNGNNINGTYNASTNTGGINVTGAKSTYQNDFKLNFDGLRKSNFTAEAASTITNVSASGAVLTHAKIVEAQANLGRHGTSKKDLIMLVSPKVSGALRLLSEVLTVDKYGAKATVLTGEIGKLDGMTVIETDLIPEDLQYDGYRYTAAGNWTVAIMFNKNEMYFGVSAHRDRKFSIGFKDEPEYDSFKLIPQEDIGFVPRFDESIVQITFIDPRVG